MESIFCKNVSKKYKKKIVLEDVNLELEPGKIYGLIGRNGAGKTTLLSMIAAHAPVTEGLICLGEEEIWENPNALEHICFSRQLNPSMIMVVKDYFKLASMYYPHWDENYAKQLIEKFELETSKPVSKLSKGMQSMVTIVAALASKADYTFMDEPVSGLDVISRDLFYKLLIDEYAETGRTFVISTHIIDEASDIFEEVIVLNQNQIVIKENTQELLERAVFVSGKAEEVDKAVKGMNCYHAETIGRSKSVTVLLEEGQRIEDSSELTTRAVTLQNLFVALCGKED
ncbi:MAG: ABC transporter ATP-binding protein [Lachnospiraceae bacterium]|nr:ABC transporter ATP-binding protein [Lachnospiraceae bacterium]